jgi:hypothetical protein
MHLRGSCLQAPYLYSLPLRVRDQAATTRVQCNLCCKHRWTQVIQLIFKADRLTDLTVIDFTPYHLVCLYRMSNHVQPVCCHEDFTRALRSGSDLARCETSVVPMEWLGLCPCWELTHQGFIHSQAQEKEEEGTLQVREFVRSLGTAVPGGTSHYLDVLVAAAKVPLQQKRKV